MIYVKTLYEFAEIASVDPVPTMGGRDKMGKPLRRAIESFLQEHIPERGTLIIDLSGPQDITASVAHEIGPRLIQKLLDGVFGEKYIAYKGGMSDTQLALQDRFSKAAKDSRGILVARVLDYQAPIFGDGISPYLLETLKFIIDRSPVTAEDLIKELNLQKTNASKRLKELYDLKLIKRDREVRPSGGRQFVYQDIVSR